jgi:hypothetical protein
MWWRKGGNLMRYEKPYVRSVGTATALIQGGTNSSGDSAGGGNQQPHLGLSSKLEEL